MTALHYGENFLEEALHSYFSSRKGKRVVLTDSLVQELYANPLAEQLGATLITIPRGEKAKAQEIAFMVLQKLFELGVDKDTTLLAMGGGSTTDLGGFVASICLRGIPLVLIPTTLLACVDAAIGSKTAIDTPFGKNLIGSFYPPQAIFIDIHLLKTLPHKEWLNGLAEVLKMGLIHDPLLCDSFEKEDLSWIRKAIEGKREIVKQDPQDQSIRRILNFGHTVAHALEAISHYELSHGEAVALGCLVESYLSLRLGYLSQADFSRIETLYSLFPKKLPQAYTRTAFLQALQRDKKNKGGAVRFVLIDRIGHALAFEGAYVRPVSLEELTPVLDWMEEKYV